MPARHYMLLNQFTMELAKSWPTYRVETAAPEAAFLRYNAAANTLVAEIAESNPLGPEITHEPAPHGISILFRYCHIATLLAANDGISIAELTNALSHDNSFAPLNQLLDSPRKVTSRAETELGLIPKIYPIDDHTLSHWAYDGEAVSVPDMALVMMNARYDASIQGHDVSGGSCPANRAKIMKPLFDSVVQICAKDENLFERSLTEAGQKSPTSVIM